MIFLVTGVAGFIGFHMSYRLLNCGHQVIGVDNLHHCSELLLKEKRLEQILTHPAFTFKNIDLLNYKSLFDLFSQYDFNRVIHLAAYTGVRDSISQPHIYNEVNSKAHLNILELCRIYKISHLLYASSSSVYGLNRKTPFSINDAVDNPISPYAATKKSNELMAHVYSYLYNLPTTGLRFFTVYGPWGRPDMALFKFTHAILARETINIYNYGNMKRDFTYIDDVIEVIMRLQNKIPTVNELLGKESKKKYINSAPYCIYNIGTGVSVNLLTYVELLEKILGVKAKKNLIQLTLGEILETQADIKELYESIHFRPNTSIEVGIKKFTEWYLKFYHKNTF